MIEKSKSHHELYSRWLFLLLEIFLETNKSAEAFLLVRRDCSLLQESQHSIVQMTVRSNTVATADRVDAFP